MANGKTALSLEGPLLTRIDALARELQVPRSQLVARAVEEFLRRQESVRLAAQIDRAYADGPTPEEIEYRRLMKRKHRKLVEGEW